MAACARCTHADDLHDPATGGNGLGPCTQGDGCPVYIELIPPGTNIYACGMDGVLVVDWGLHDAYHGF